MTIPKLLAVICLCMISRGASSADYIFANSYEIECDGGGCTYCSPNNPEPVCGTSSHCTPHVNTTSVCSTPAGVGTTGFACTALAQCGEPFACVNTGVATTCQEWCQLPSGICPGSGTCMSLPTPLFTGTTEWGICI